jgi:hypothetical protein
MDAPPRNVGGGKSIPAKNKTPAPVQITAEQLLREAKERQLEYVAPVGFFLFYYFPNNFFQSILSFWL